jgi:hypothetical protein
MIGGPLGPSGRSHAAGSGRSGRRNEYSNGVLRLAQGGYILYLGSARLSPQCLFWMEGHHGDELLHTRE